MSEYDLVYTSLITVLTVIATATMALSGVLQAYRHDFDPLGAAVLALMTAVGGGTVRDLLLGATPVFWVTDLIYIGTVTPVVFLATLFARRLHGGGGRRERMLNYLDAIGLALFSILGAQKALGLGIHPLISVIMGCVTGIAGGMIRDVLCNEKPVVLRQDLYATLSLAGGGLMFALMQFFTTDISMIVAFVFILVARVGVIRKGINLPKPGNTWR